MEDAVIDCGEKARFKVMTEAEKLEHAADTAAGGS